VDNIAISTDVRTCVGTCRAAALAREAEFKRAVRTASVTCLGVAVIALKLPKVESVTTDLHAAIRAELRAPGTIEACLYLAC